MDWDEIGNIFFYLVPLVLFLVFNIVFRKQQEQKRREAVVKSLLSEIDYNYKLIDSFSLRWQTKKFKTATWERNKNKIDYMEGEGLYFSLVNAYEIIEGFNREIDMAKKYNSTSYLVNIEVERLKGPLERSRQGLQEWIEMSKARKEIPDQAV